MATHKKIVVKKMALAPAMGVMKQKAQQVTQMAQAGRQQIQKSVIKEMEQVKGPAPKKRGKK